METNDRISFLKEEIKRHNNLYWVEGNEEITDPEYDNLVRELDELEPGKRPSFLIQYLNQ